MTLDEQVKKYKDLISNSWNRHTREALTKVVGQIGAIGGAITAEELASYDSQIAQIMGTPVAEAVRRPLVRLNAGTYASGALEASKDAGVAIGFGLPDIKALRSLDENLFFWIGSYYPDVAQGKMQDRLKEYFTGGLNRRDLALRFRADFLGEMRKGDSYWDLLADHTATKTREIGRVAGYEKANVKTIRVKARLDDKTTTICRKLHGQVISVEVLRDQVTRYMKQVDKKSKSGVKKAWPWITEKQAKKLTTQAQLDTAVDKGKIGLPPYHARCRTRTVAEFSNDAGDRYLTDKDKERGAIPLKSRRGKPGPKPKPKRGPDVRASWATRSIRSVKTVDDAAAWMESRHPAIASEFYGIEGEAIEELLKPSLVELDRLLRKYPHIEKDNYLRYFGTQSGPKWKAHIERYFGKGTKKRPGSFANSNNWAQAFPETKSTRSALGGQVIRFDGAIGLNPKSYNDIKGFKWSLENAAKTGFHPKGLSNVDHVITHEFDHTIDHFMTARSNLSLSRINDPRLRLSSLIQGFKRKWRMPEKLSLYARENMKEGWAESSAAAKWGVNTLGGKRNPYVKAQQKFLKKVFGQEFHESGKWVDYPKALPAEQDEVEDLIEFFKEEGIIS